MKDSVISYSPYTLYKGKQIYEKNGMLYQRRTNSKKKKGWVYTAVIKLTCTHCNNLIFRRKDSHVLNKIFCGPKCQNGHRVKMLKYPKKRGFFTDKSGYIKMYSPDHVKADANGYVYQHRLVIEKKVGRVLNSNENVHHKNGIRNDNSLGNLELWTRPQPTGARVEDLLSFYSDFLLQHHPKKDELLQILKG